MASRNTASRSTAWHPWGCRSRNSSRWVRSSRRHTRTLLDLTNSEQASLASIISVIRKKYDNLYGFLMPLMMAVKQGPLQLPDEHYHFHVQFLPLQRSPTKLKYLASIETAYGTFLADTTPEEMAQTLREREPVTTVDVAREANQSGS